MGKALIRSFSKENIRTVSKHITRCSTSLAFREMEIKTTVRHHFTPSRLARIREMGNNELARMWRN